MTVNRPLVLTTDFGLTDPYVGVMKGVILSINPRASIIDLTHQIQPQNLQQALFLLGNNHKFFPKESIHLVVVDPGVGTDRKAILLITPDAAFLAPDNGVLSGVLADYQGSTPEGLDLAPVPPQCTAYQLTNSDYWRHPVSSTFHGRDIFAPVAAHLSLGIDPASVGEPLTELVWLATPKPTMDGPRIIGQVLYADHFGNLITNIPESMLKGGGAVQVEVKGYRIKGLSKTFHDDTETAPGQPLALLGSNGYLEIAVREGSAADLIVPGDSETVWVTLSPPA